MKFLEAMKRADAALASLTNTGLDDDKDFAGYRQVSNRNLPPQAVLRMRKFIEGIKTGSLPRLDMMLTLREAQTTSDFPYLMGDNMYRELLGQYQQVEVSWPMIARKRSLNDFRLSRSIVLDGGTSRWRPVAEQAPYKQILFTDGKYDVQVYKFGEKAGFSWESTINDDLDALSRIPLIMGQGARNMEEYNFTNLYAGNATFFSLANKNTVVIANGASSNNPALSPGAITDALTVMRKQTNSDSSPILIDGAILVVPTALEETARRILAALEFRWNDPGGASNQTLISGNTLTGRVKMVVAPWLDVIDASSHGATGWYLFADPNKGRPAAQIAFLRGREKPQLFQKAPDSIMVGGGGADVMEGSFDNDTIEYKGRHCVGVGLVDPKMAVYSEGDGT